MAVVAVVVLVEGGGGEKSQREKRAGKKKRNSEKTTEKQFIHSFIHGCEEKKRKREERVYEVIFCLFSRRIWRTRITRRQRENKVVA